MEVPDIQSAADRLVELGPGGANHVVLRYRSELVQKDCSASTINLRLAAVRSLMGLARVLGIVTWALQVRNVKVSKNRDVRGLRWTPKPGQFDKV